MTGYTLENQNWELKVQNKGDRGFSYTLYSKINNKVYADEEYYYRILTSSKKGSRYAYLVHLGSEYKAKKLSSRKIRMEGTDRLIIEGKFAETNISIIHEFILEKGSKWLDEKITLINRGSKKVRIGLINLGFMKEFFKQYAGWVDNLDEYTLTAIPTRRYFGYGEDRRKENFSANDILLGPGLKNKQKRLDFVLKGGCGAISREGYSYANTIRLKWNILDFIDFQPHCLEEVLRMLISCSEEFPYMRAIRS